MDIFLFLVKYTPFWAVPIGMISFHFAYLYWLKDYREISYLFGISLAFCVVFLLVYLAMGGPDHSVQTFVRLFYQK